MSRHRQQQTPARVWTIDGRQVPIRDLSDRDLLRSVHFVELRRLIFRRRYPELLKEARYRHLIGDHPFIVA